MFWGALGLQASGARGPFCSVAPGRLGFGPKVFFGFLLSSFFPPITIRVQGSAPKDPFSDSFASAALNTSRWV